MKRGAVVRWALIAWLTLGTSCTDPTFLEDGGGGAGLPDGGGAVDQREAGASEASTEGSADARAPEDGASTVRDAAEPPETPGSDAGALAVDSGAGRDSDMPSSDASTAQEADGGTPAPALPTWAKPLLGRYLKQSISVGYDSNIRMPVVTSERSLVTVVEEANAQLVMQIQTCSFNSQWYDQSIRFALAKPSALAPFKVRVILGEAPHFSTETVNRAVGFDPARQASCGGMGQRINKFADQIWVTGSSCTCATYPELPPQASNDCRLTDPDGDRQPGVLISSTTGVFNFSVAMSTSLKVVDGVVAQDREHTLREQGRANVGCANMGEDNCTLGTPAPCGDVVTDLRPLADDATCATVLAYNLPVGTLPVDKCPTNSP